MDDLLEEYKTALIRPGSQGLGFDIIGDDDVPLYVDEPSDEDQVFTEAEAQAE